MSELRMPKLNVIILSARLTRDPELKYTQSGTAVAKLSLAFDRSFQKDGEWVQEASYIDAVVWNKRAEQCAEQLHKGSPLLVEGYLKTRTYQNKENVNIKVTEIVAHKVNMLEKSEQMSGNSEQHQVTDDDVVF